jgi:Uncharacterized protein conserved in bacteria (DUF2252)
MGSQMWRGKDNHTGDASAIVAEAVRFRSGRRVDTGTLRPRRLATWAVIGALAHRDRADLVWLRTQVVTGHPSSRAATLAHLATEAFTFYQGAVLIMAADLKETRKASLGGQQCGDAHFVKLRCLCAPERAPLLDLNDFDATLPGRSSTTSDAWRRT